MCTYPIKLIEWIRLRVATVLQHPIQQEKATTTDEKYTKRGQRHLSYSELGKLDGDLAAAAGNTALGAIAGIILTIAQCHNECNNENQEANHCYCEFDPRKHLFFPVRYKNISETVSNIQHWKKKVHNAWKGLGIVLLPV